MSLSAEKKKSLQASGTLNPHPEAVQAELFSRPFFDPHDRVQVKYEMLRAQQVERLTITKVCRQFGFSRESFYRLRESFQKLGFRAFLPAKRGRKGPTKLKGEVLEFVLNKKREDPDIDPGRLTELIAQHYGIEVHRTTVLRGLKKKLSTSQGSGSRVGPRHR
jgi:transposase